MADIGKHLLGRKPSPPDDRDWKLEYFLAPQASIVDQAIAELKQTTVGYKNRYWTTPPSNSHWAKAMALLAQLEPAPPNPLGDVIWTNPRGVLDQGDTGHCVGFGWADWGNTSPVNDSYVNKDGHDIYYECKVIDGEPGAEDGSYVRSGAKAMQNRKRLSAYAFATDINDIKAWVRTKGPLVVGTDWYTQMFYPDANGYIAPKGSVEGGHCYVLMGDLPNENAAVFLNSWGTSWGDGGYFKMVWDDFAFLLKDFGEACASLELNL